MVNLWRRLNNYYFAGALLRKVLRDYEFDGIKSVKTKPLQFCDKKGIIRLTLLLAPNPSCNMLLNRKKTLHDVAIGSYLDNSIYYISDPNEIC